MDIDKIKFPISTDKAAQLIGCSVRTVAEHCLKNKVRRLYGKKGPYLIDKDIFIMLKNEIRDRPGNPDFG